MMKTEILPSSRVNLIQEYYFSRKLKQIAEMRQKGLNVINLGIGSPDLPPSEPVIKALHSASANPGNHGYQSYYGIPELRNAFSEWYKAWFKVELRPSDEILPLIGSKEGIMHISMAFLNPGDEALVPNPGYPTYEAATKLAGGKVRYYDLTEDGRWLPDIDMIEAAGVGNVKIMWINYPHMPTGTKASPEIFSALVSFARKHKILLVNDNPYSFILNDDLLSILSVEGAMDVSLELNSMSKSHNMAGWRVGMVGGHADYISAVVKVKSNMDSGMFQPLQAAAALGLAAPVKWYNELNRVYRLRRVAAEELMKSIGCRFDPDQSGLFLWGKIPEGYRNGEDLTEKLLHDAHVFITPGSVFGSNGADYVRISLCATEEAIKEATARIKDKTHI